MVDHAAHGKRQRQRHRRRDGQEEQRRRHHAAVAQHIGDEIAQRRQLSSASRRSVRSRLGHFLSFPLLSEMLVRDLCFNCR